MATVFMRWLETSAQDYEQGIRMLTVGRLRRLDERTVRDHVRKGSRVLELGCGTATLAVMMARQGASKPRT